MLPSVKNKQTLSILDRMKQKGPPSTEMNQSLDMTLPVAEEGEEDALNDSENDILQPIQGGAKKDKKKQVYQGPLGY